jgi:transposase
MRRGFDGLAALVQMQLAEDPFSGQLFVFRGRSDDRINVLWSDGDGLCLFAKRLERGHFVCARSRPSRTGFRSDGGHFSGIMTDSIPM